MTAVGITATTEWAALVRHVGDLRADGVSLGALFESDPGRAQRFTSVVGDLVIDWSKHLVTDETVELLAGLGERAGVTDRLAAMMAGEPVNVTEGRPALHTALRAGPAAAAGGDADPAEHGALAAGAAAVCDSAAVSGAVAAASAERRRMADFARGLCAGERRGVTGRRIRTVVGLGIGGSHLGPAMAYEALAAFRQPGIECRFVSNVDPAALASALDGLDAAETLFVVVSKSFTTAETLANASAARTWAESALGMGAASGHFVAVTADRDAAVTFGVAVEDTFAMWDWVGGRFSLASSAGLALMAAVGEEHFAELLDGMRVMDDHVAAALAGSAPATLGLLSVWYRNFWGLSTRALVAYSQRLRLFADWLQQVMMESNGKQVLLDGTPVDCDTGEIVWGGSGTDSQHSFHQLLHQGTTVVPADFIVCARPDPDTVGVAGAAPRHEALVANCLAQSAALAFGASGGGDPHRELAGNRPSTVIVAPELTPSVLGQLMALYEHQAVVQGTVWGINSFDQFGVEHGKHLADAIAADLKADAPDPAPGHDPSTKALIAHYLSLRQR